MKKLYILIPLLLLFFSARSQDVTLSIKNAEITTDGVDSFYEADVYISSIEGFKLGLGQFYLAYNPDAFGPQVTSNNNIEFITNDDPLQGDVSILEFEPFPGAPFYGLPAVINDNGTTGAVSFFWNQGGFGPVFLPENNVTEIPALLARVKFRYIDVTQEPNVCFETSLDSFNDQLFLACGTGGLACGDRATQIFDFISDCDGAILPIACTDTTTYIGGDWNNGEPDKTMVAIIAENYNTSINNIEACRLTVGAGATLTINAGEFIEIQGEITVDGNLIVAHEGSVVQIEDNAAVINNGSITVAKTTPIMDNRDFMVLGSPMTTVTSELAHGTALHFRNHLTENFVPNPVVASQDPMAENFADDNSDNWQAYTGIMNPGEGYLTLPQETPTISTPTSYNFQYNQGTLNNGIINFNVQYNGTQNASPNVLSNPYASAIDADNFISTNSMVNAVYFWNPISEPVSTYPGFYTLNYDMGDISMYNLVGGIAASNGGSIPTQYISSGKGFGVKATAAGTATFKNSMRVTGNNDAYKDGSTRDRIWISLENQEFNLQSTTLIGFSENTTPGLDAGYDSRRLATAVSLFTGIGDTELELGIQSREAFVDGIEIPMGFSSMIETETNFTVSIKTVEGENLENANVYLYDNKLDIITNLTTDGTYSFISGKNSDRNRFSLMFESKVLGINDNDISGIKLFPNPAKNELRIISPQTVVVQAEVYDVQGRRVMKKIFDSGEYKMDLSNLRAAMYFVKLETEKGIIHKQIIKK